MPDKYKKDISIEVLVGLFMFTILIALGVFTIVLSRQNFLQKKYPITVVFDEVGGLREGDRVFLRGTQVGVVDSTHLENNHVLVQSDLKVAIQFREGYRVEVVAASMLGGKALKLYEGPLRADPLSPDTVIRGEPPIDILEELGIAAVGLRGMADEVAAGKGTLGKLINDEEMYAQMKSMMANLNQITECLLHGEGTIGKLLSKDDDTYEQINEMVANLNQVSERLASGEGTLGKLLSKNDQLYQDIQASAASIRGITEKMESGGGTIGRLLEDDQLYVDARELLEELRAAVDDMRETSPVTTFSTIFFGAF